MPYVNKFMSLINDSNPAYGTFSKIIDEGIEHEATLAIALDMLECASTGLRQAAAYGCANDCLIISDSIKLLSEQVNKFQNNPDSQTTKNSYLFKTSTNKNSALDWALKNSGPIQIEERGEYALCVAILLQLGFSEKNLQDINKDPEKPLYGFITEYSKYEEMHNNLRFDDVYGDDDNPKATPRIIMLMKGLYYVTSYYFMRSHQKALTEYVTSLKKDNVKEINVFEIGSSIPYELMALCNFFASHEIKMNYHGFDVNEEAMITSRIVFTPVTFHQINFEKVEGQTLDKFEKYKQNGDLIILRHPDVLGTTTRIAFNEILAQTALNLIKPSGLFLVSCYWQDEANIVCEILKKPAETFVQHKSDFILFGGGAILKRVGGGDRPYVADQFSLSLTAQQLRDEYKPVSKPKQ